MDSIWTRDIHRPSFKALKGNAITDVLIVGGGITGILCGYMLKKAGIDCMILEADRICGGVTQNTTAKITIQHGLFCNKQIKCYGEETARQYLKAQQRAFDIYAELCKDIPCDYEAKDSYVYSLNDPDKLSREVKALNSLGIAAELTDTPHLPFATAGAVRIAGQAQFHPLKFLYSIAEQLPVYENTKVTQFLPDKVITEHGTVEYNKLIIATHFPIINKHGGYFFKLYQHRSYVLALKGAQDVKGIYVDESETGLSFRNYADLLLLGGGGHRTGKQGGCWQELEAFARKYYKNAEIVGRWATQDCISLDTIPYIGQYSKAIPNVYTATGFNKWGMTNAMVSADILCDLVRGKSNPYAGVFSAYRSLFHTQLAINILESSKGLLTPTSPRCPHLGCALKYNPAEHSWDCPCHGSRFSENGKLIDNPATDDKRL
ncbi:MAG: FAD-dependent oxidoreductase [Clostridia bacterium]|nr:FAD-dependent oxidoreductase [Clostridia bacterium]